MEFRFKTNDQVYTIPSDLFPISHPDSLAVLNHRNFSEIKDENLLNAINSIELELGRCYDNSKKLEKELEKAGYEAFLCSGWLFAGSMPFHHAWVFISDGDKFYMIDSAFHQVTDAVLARVKGRGDVREEFKKYWKEEMESRKLNTERMIAGIPSKELVYVGSPDTYKGAVSVYKQISKMENHPSYTGGMNNSGYSLLQMEIMK